MILTVHIKIKIFTSDKRCNLAHDQEDQACGGSVIRYWSLRKSSRSQEESSVQLQQVLCQRLVTER